MPRIALLKMLIPLCAFHASLKHSLVRAFTAFGPSTPTLAHSHVLGGQEQHPRCEPGSRSARWFFPRDSHNTVATPETLILQAKTGRWQPGCKPQAVSPMASLVCVWPSAWEAQLWALRASATGGRPHSGEEAKTCA